MARSRRSRRHDVTGRSTGEPSHIRLYRWLTSCPAWCALTSVERDVLIEIWRRNTGSNNGEIAFGVREAGRIGVGKNPTSEAIQGLIDLGFIEVMQVSTFDQKKLARTYRITAEPTPDGKPATKEFMAWRGPRKKKVSPAQRTTQSRTRDSGGASKVH